MKSQVFRGFPAFHTIVERAEGSPQRGAAGSKIQKNRKTGAPLPTASARPFPALPPGSPLRASPRGEKRPIFQWLRPFWRAIGGARGGWWIGARAAPVLGECRFVSGKCGQKPAKSLKVLGVLPFPPNLRACGLARRRECWARSQHIQHYQALSSPRAALTRHKPGIYRHP